MGDGSHSTEQVSVRYATDLVLSLVGVADARVVTDAAGRFLRLDVVPDAGVTDHAILRNVTSALRAALDVDLKQDMIRVVATLPQIAPPAPARLVLVRGGAADGPKPTNNKLSDDARHAPAPQPASQPSTAFAGASAPQERPAPPGQGPGVVASTHGNLAHELARRAAERPPPEIGQGNAALPSLESVELERTERRIRCRVVVVAEGRRYAAMAVANLGPGIELHVAARAAVDALRAVGGRLADLSLEGATMTQVSGRPHVLASVQRWTGGDLISLAGTAEVTDKPERAAALAILRAALHSPEAEH